MKSHLLGCEVNGAVRKHAEVFEYALIVDALAAEGHHNLLHVVGYHVYEFVAGFSGSIRKQCLSSAL